MKKYLLMFMGLFSTLVAANGVETSITAGYGTKASIYKGKEYSEIDLPVSVSISYKNFYLNGTQLGAKFIDTRRFSTTIFAELQDGHSIKGSKMDTGYKSIKKRRSQQTVGLKADIRLDEISENLTLFSYFSTGKRGNQVGAGLSCLYVIGEKFALSPSVSTTYFSKKYTDYYFGIDKNELGGNIKNEYNPDGAFELEIGLYGEYYFTEHISALAYVNMSKYSSEVRRSPITKNGIATNIGLGLKLSF